MWIFDIPQKPSCNMLWNDNHEDTKQDRKLCIAFYFESL